MDKPHYWWYVYGYFDSGEGNYPHIGQVLRYYRKMNGLTKENLAATLECSKRYIEMLESDQNVTSPELISRRRLLARVLHIPHILLGLSSIVEHTNEEENVVPLSKLPEIEIGRAHV